MAQQYVADPVNDLSLLGLDCRLFFVAFGFAALGVGWFGRQWEKGRYNPTTGAFIPGPGQPTAHAVEFLGRISFCQAVGLFEAAATDAAAAAAAGGPEDSSKKAGQLRRVNSRAGRQRRTLDNISQTWRFDCGHDPTNASTWSRCQPSPDHSARYEVWYDDADTLQPKMAAAAGADWAGIGIWQADGMWPHGDALSNVSVYCKPELDKMWAAVRTVFG